MQWLAPLASEAPEFIIAGLFAWRLQTDTALGALVSSKVNQWTLLVGSLPIVFAISLAEPARAADRRDAAAELLLTAAQSLFAVAMIVNLRMSLREAWWIFGLFWAQFIASAVGGTGPARGGAGRDVGDLPGRSAVWLLVRHRAATPGCCCATGSARPTPRCSAQRRRPEPGPRGPTGVPRPRSPPIRPRPTSLVHVEDLPARDASRCPSPTTFRRCWSRGWACSAIEGLYAHQAEGLEVLAAGRDVMLATGTASGKSLVYQLAAAEPALTDAEGHRAVPVPDEGARARPAPRGPRAQAPAGPSRGLRRRHAAGRTAADPDEREPRADEPRHAPRCRCSPITRGGPTSSCGCPSWWSTRRTCCAACSARTSRWCSGGCGG